MEKMLHILTSRKTWQAIVHEYIDLPISYIVKAASALVRGSIDVFRPLTTTRIEEIGGDDWVRGRHIQELQDDVHEFAVCTIVCLIFNIL